MQSFPFNFLTFPFWWYTEGLVLAWQWAGRSFKFTLKKSALRIFLRHFGDTLYGYRSRADVVMSFFVRIFLLIIKLFAIAFKAMFLLIALALYLVAIPMIIALIIYYF